MIRFVFLLIITFGIYCKGVTQDRKPGEPLREQNTVSEFSRLDERKIDSLKRRIQQLEKLHQTSDLLVAMQNLAVACERTGHYDLFLQNAREMLNVAGEVKNDFTKAYAYINIGVALTDKGKLDSASYYEYQALQIANRLQHDSLQAEAYACLSGIYNYRKDYQQSLRFCDLALQHAQKWKTSNELLAVCLSCKAITLTLLQRHQEAIQLDEQVLPLAQSLSFPDYLITTKMNLASNYVLLHHYNEAKYYLTELERDMPAYHISPIYFTGNMIVMGMTYRAMGDNKKAATILLQTIPAAKELNYGSMLKRIYDTLSVIAETSHQYKEALVYKKEAQHYLLQEQKQNSDQLFSELEVRYKTTEKEKSLSLNQLQLAQKDLQLQKNRYYNYYILTALVIALFLAALLYLKSQHKKRVHIRELKAIQQQKELHFLQALMQGEEKERSRIAKDLHDGVAGMLAAVKMHFSSMPAADDLLQTEGYRQGMKLLNEVTHEIRKTSHNLMPEVLLQHGLDEALRRFCNSINNSKAVKIQYDSWGEIDRFTDSFELSIYRIVQELISNIIKHSKASQAIVQLTQQDNLLSISIEDNGVGFSQINGADGMGLHSLQSRIEAMNGKMEMQASEQSGVSAYLEFEIADIKKEIASVYE